MIPGKRIQRTQLEKSGAKLFSGIAPKTTNITTYHLHSQHILHKMTSNRQPKKSEIAVVIPSPVSSPPVTSKGVTSAENEGPTPGLEVLEGAVTFHHAEVDMGVSLQFLAVVSGIEGNIDHFYVLAPRMVRNVIGIVYDCFPFGWLARPIAKVGNLVHIQPASCKINLSVQMGQHINPILSGIRMEIINKISQPRPYLTLLVLTFRRLNIHISFLSLLISIPLSTSDTRLNNRHIFITISYFLHSVQREIISIHCKCLEIVHVINITPNYIQRNSILLVFL